jgi:hypothetical protein
MWGMILKLIFEKHLEDTDWIYVAKDRDRLLALVNTVMNLLCSIK